MAKFISILLIQILCGMEMDLFIPSFPELQQVFGLTPVLVQLTLSVNFVALCICSLFAGALGDRFNRRTMMLSGLVIFVVGSLCCVLAPSFNWLLIGRFLQGVGISAPAILSFPVILEDYSGEKQASMMGLINGVKTLAMAIAPVIGSFVNLYFSWRGNFTVLLLMGMLCLLLCIFTIPSKVGNKAVSLSLKSYRPLITSSYYLKLMFSISLLTAAYWLFMAMAPIFYMSSLQVPLKQFGFYQGALSLTFALVCIISPIFYHRYEQKILLKIGTFVCLLCVITLMLMSYLTNNQPIPITMVMVLFSIGIVFPINILYPIMLKALPDTKGRSAGLGQAFLLLITACLLELVGYFYTGTLWPLALTMFICVSIGTVLIVLLHKKVLSH